MSTSRLLRAGVQLTTVQKLCGHANVTTTVRHYTRVSDADEREGVAKLQAAAVG